MRAREFTAHMRCQVMALLKWLVRLASCSTGRGATRGRVACTRRIPKRINMRSVLSKGYFVAERMIARPRFYSVPVNTGTVSGRVWVPTVACSIFRLRKKDIFASRKQSNLFQNLNLGQDTRAGKDQGRTQQSNLLHVVSATPTDYSGAVCFWPP